MKCDFYLQLCQNSDTIIYHEILISGQLHSQILFYQFIYIFFILIMKFLLLREFV